MDFQFSICSFEQKKLKSGTHVVLFKGDNRSGALAKNYADGGLLAGISKKQLDGGIAGSLFQDQDLPTVEQKPG